MGLWKKIFRKNPSKKKIENSPYLQKNEEPIELSFVKNFTANGGLFLYNDSLELIKFNFKEICIENKWNRNDIVTLNQKIAELFQVHFVEQLSGKLNHFKAIIIQCEYLISNTGKILLSKHQINHFKLNELPSTIIVKAKMNQLSRDVSHGMTLLKNKYIKNIPTNITTLNTSFKSSNDRRNLLKYNKSKNIYLLLEDF